jgi:NAD(P)H-nitrite reductase large subunit
MAAHLLILGNSAAAISAVRAIRAHGGEQRITIVSREECSAYAPVLTSYYLRGRIPEEHLGLCDMSYWLDWRVTCRFGRTAVVLDTEAQRVTLDDDSSLDYDSLLIATGASPKHLGGLDPEIDCEICYLRTIADARRIKERADRARHVVIIGAGLVGLQVASAVARPDLKLTCVVASQRILSQNIDSECAALLREHVERSANIEFLFGSSVTEIARTHGGYRLCLDSGEELNADAVIAGKGVDSNMDFVDWSQIDVDRGIFVDEQMRTSVPNVYAAGDLAQETNSTTGRSELITNWPSACEQGRIAGVNMAGGSIAFEGSLAENSITLFGVPVVSIGIVRACQEGPKAREVRYLDETLGVYRRLFLHDEQLVGAVLLRETEDASVLRSAIVNATQLSCPSDAALRHPLIQAQRSKAWLQVACEPVDLGAVRA